MGTFDENRKSKEEIKKKNEIRKEKMAGFFYDLSKLSFAGLVIGGFSPLIINLDNSMNWVTAISGVISTCGLAFLANRILK